MRLLLIIWTLLIIGCSPPDSEVITLSVQKNTIPKGIAVHPVSKDIYLSSIHLDQVTRSNISNGTTKVILDRENDGYSIGAGLDFHGNRLYALGRYDRDSFSMLFIKNLDTDRLLSYQNDNLGRTLFNDLAVDKNGNGYITDTDNHKIYKYNNDTRSIKSFYDHEQIKHPHGIAISDDQTKLFVDSYSHGIRIIDIESKSILNTLHSPTAQWGVDGIKYHNEKLYFIVNGIKDKSQHGLYSLDLIDNESEFGNLDPVLVFHEKMRLPTSFSIVDNFFYVLANSQLNLLDQDSNMIIDTSRLSETYILGIAIKKTSSTELRF